MYYKVPLRFQREVILHVLKNTQENLLVDGASAILGIFGPPGEGKTVMCQQVLEDLGAHVEKMSVGEFESPNAGRPVERLKEIYGKAKAKLLTSPNAMSVMLIDDIDTALGNWGEMTQYTVNTQLIVGELMQLATDIKERKVPIIITGNDFSKLYGPLKRSGRMTSFYWEPSNDERLDSVKTLFPWLSVKDCLKYVKYVESFSQTLKMGRPPVSFFATVKSKLYDDALWNQVIAERHKTFDASYITRLLLPPTKDFSVGYIILKSQEIMKNIKNNNKSYV